MAFTDWFKGQEVLVVETAPKPKIVEDEAVMETLASHPGFMMLMQRLKLQKEFLQAKLVSEKHASIREVDSLQSGIHWLSYLDDTIHKIVNKQVRPKPFIPQQSIMDEFNLINSNIELVK